MNVAAHIHVIAFEAAIAELFIFAYIDSFPKFF